MEIRFKLNPKNEKDKRIIELLGGEYNSTDFIKSLLYKVVTGVIQGGTMTFGGYVNSVNVLNSFTTTPQTDCLEYKTDIEGTLANNDIGIQFDNSENIRSEFADYF